MFFSFTRLTLLLFHLSTQKCCKFVFHNERVRCCYCHVGNIRVIRQFAKITEGAHKWKCETFRRYSMIPETGRRVVSCVLPVSSSGSTSLLTSAATVWAAGNPHATTCRNEPRHLSFSGGQQRPPLANHQPHKQTHLSTKQNKHAIRSLYRFLMAFYDRLITVQTLALFALSTPLWSRFVCFVKSANGQRGKNAFGFFALYLSHALTRSRPVSLAHQHMAHRDCLFSSFFL